MNSREILHAVQTGKMNSEDARQELMRAMKSAQEPSAKFDPTLSASKRCDPVQTFDGPNKPENDIHEEIPAEKVIQPAVAFCEVEPGVVLVTMQDRKNKNAFSEELADGLTLAFDAIEANPRYKVVILTGYDNYFASGGTKERLLDIHEGRVKYTDTNIYWLALNCKLPVIAAMQGHAFGAGWCMGMFCDFIVMSRESVYSANFMKFDFTPGAGSTLIFPEKFGFNLGQEILFTGKKYYGSEFAARGASFTVLPQKDVLPHALQLANTLAMSSRETLAALKDHMSGSIRQKLPATVEKELKLHEKTFLHKPQVKERIQSSYGALAGSCNELKRMGITAAVNEAKRETGYAIRPEYMKQERTPDVNCSISDVPGSNSTMNSIAIIGMAGQFPKAKNLEEFWDNIANGVDCISEIPSTRWPIHEYYDPDPKALNKTYSKWGGLIEDYDKFDSLFFSISPVEAELMDPQQRLFLESCWHCVEDAGLNSHALSGSRCGVFVGCTPGDYNQLIGERGLNAQGLMGNSNAILAARISYMLNLKGPCLSIDTACSASLVAVAEACDSLVLGNSDLALAGGVCSLTGPSMHVMSSKAGMLSPDGKCFAFDSRANGFVPGEGVGVVLLKRLPDAIRDKDHIYGVIRGWGVNQDGKTNGITAPSVNSQIFLEKEVYRRFHINPETISMVEAQATGSKLGDSIELEALTEAFQLYTYKRNYCALGSVKSNIGHLYGAGGIAGLIKASLSLYHRMLPPTINFEKLNENISLDRSPFYINTHLQPWMSAAGAPRRAAVSSFGFSGTNAHVVLEEYVPGKPASGIPVIVDSDHPVLIVLSAKSDERLKTYAESIRKLLETRQDIALADMAYTLQVGRDAMDCRLAFLAHSREEIIKALDGFIHSNPIEGTRTSRLNRGKAESRPKPMDQNERALMYERTQREKLEMAAELWVKGEKVEWDKLYGAIKPCRISLPQYPFERKRYWAAEVIVNVSAPASVPAAHDSHGEVDDEESIFCGYYSESTIKAGLEKMVTKILGIPRGEIEITCELARYGLDSISGMSLIDSIRKQFGIELSPRDIFENNSIGQLTEYLLKTKGLEGKAALGAEKTKTVTFPLSSAQKSLWTLNQWMPDNYAYNLPSAFYIRKEVDRNALKAAFGRLVLRHPILAAGIRMAGQEPTHEISTAGSFSFKAESLSNISETELKDYLIKTARQPFDLENGPLMKVHLFYLSNGEHVLLINIHHIVFDGSSLPVLMKELICFYKAEVTGEKEDLPLLQRSYADFVGWQLKLLASKEGQKHKEYWMNKLSGELPVLNLPISKPRTENSSFRGKTYDRELSYELTRQIQNLSLEEKVSPFVMMLSVFMALLYRYTNQEELMVGTVVQGRPGKEYENLIGLFTNMVVIKSNLSKDTSFGDLLNQVRNNTFEALEHGNYPYAEIVKEKGGIRKRGNCPLIQVVFLFQNWLKNTGQLFASNKDVNDRSLLTLELIPEIHQEGEFDITLEVILRESKYNLLFKYNPELFESETIERMCENYIEMIKSVIADCRQNVAQMAFIAEEKSSFVQPEIRALTKEQASNAKSTITSVYKVRM